MGRYYAYTWLVHQVHPDTMMSLAEQDLQDDMFSTRFFTLFWHYFDEFTSVLMNSSSTCSLGLVSAMLTKKPTP